MIKAMIHGCNGAMGQVISQLIAAEEEITVIAGIDLTDNKHNPYPVYSSLNNCGEKADVMIDFASAKAVDSLLDYCVEKQIPVVLCTTGLSEIQINKIEESSKRVAILRSANMSLGINMLLKLLKEATQILSAADFDIEIIEKHHNQKLDAPSGTALAMADCMNEALDHDYHYKYDRTVQREKRDKKEIGIQSVRGGSLVGEHEVIFAGQDEVVTFTHTAYSKTIFAKGAVEAAKYLSGRQPGLYTMFDVIE